MKDHISTIFINHFSRDIITTTSKKKKNNNFDYNNTNTTPTFKI